MMTERESFFGSLLDQLPGEIVVFDRNYRYVYVNPKSIADPEMRKWIIGKTDFEYCAFKGISTELAEKRVLLFKQVEEEDREIELHERMVSKDGGVKYHIRRLRPYRNDAGEFTHFLGYGFDFTEQQKLKDELAINNKIAKNITPAFLADMLYAGLLDSKKFDTVEAVIDDMIAVNYYSYKRAVLLMVGKLTRDFLTPSQTI